MQDDSQEGVPSQCSKGCYSQEHTLLPAKEPWERVTNSPSCAIHENMQAQPFSILDVPRDVGVGASKGFSAQPPMAGQGVELAEMIWESNFFIGR